MPEPRPKAVARARFNNAEEAEEQVDNEEFEPIGTPNKDKNAWKLCDPWRKKNHSNATLHPYFGHGHAHGHGFHAAPFGALLMPSVLLVDG